MQKLKTTRLTQHDKASLQSLSGGMAGEKLFYHKYLIGKKRIENNFNLVVVESPNSLMGIDFLKNNPQIRANDLMNSIIDNSVKIIIANIGGFDSYKIINYLDIKIIKEKQKPILGYSDITSLHLFFYMMGIQTYYGPTILDGFAENVCIHKITSKSIKNVLFENKDQIIKSSKEWTSAFLDWANEDLDLVKRKMVEEKYGHIWINFDENIKGHLIGGCLDTIVQIKNESFFPKLDNWKDSVIFLETSEQKMNPKEFKKSLVLLESEINVSNAVIFGKPKDEKYFNEYLKIIKEVIKKPIIFNINFGHTAPVYTIPYGGMANLDYNNKKIVISK